MIEKIRIKGFKAFDDVQLEFGRLTLLAGRNSVGKTTVIQAVFAMLQDGNNPFRGEYMNIGKPNELQNAITGSREIMLSMQYLKDGVSKEKNKIITRSNTDVSGDSSEAVKVIYCSADRTGVKDTYEKYLGDEIIIGKNCEYAFHYLAEHMEEAVQVDHDFVYDEESKLTFGGQVDYWLGRIMGYSVKAVEIEKTEYIQVLYTDSKIPFGMRPKNVGTGVTYIAELVIAALACREGDLLVIENPEIHLHPSGQAELIKFLAMLAQYGVQVMIETHSDHIYNGIRKSIYLDDIDCENVKVYFFIQNEDGCSIPLMIPVNSAGKALVNTDGLFDQIKKDLDVILGW